MCYDHDGYCPDRRSGSSFPLNHGAGFFSCYLSPARSNPNTKATKHHGGADDHGAWEVKTYFYERCRRRKQVEEK